MEKGNRISVGKVVLTAVGESIPGVKHKFVSLQLPLHTDMYDNRQTTIDSLERMPTALAAGTLE